jgi:ferredoxin
LDLWLLALAQGASQVWVLLTDEEAPDYRRVLAEQVAIGQALLSGLGYAGEHLRLLTVRDARDLATLDSALRAAPAQTVARPSTLAAQAEKRQTLEIALDHLMAQAPLAVDQYPEAIALPAAGSPFGSLRIDTQRCTMCLSCVGACPAAALQDNPDAPQLKFIEKNCVQCGLCVGTCPETALSLEPRWWLADEGRARRQPRVLHEVAPAYCVQCAKPFGTAPGVEAMVAKLSGHAAFAGDGVRRLRMCNDCRVVAMFTNPNEVKIGDIR